jgi:methyltransferase-like protein
MDFLRNRSFRQTLLCHKHQHVDRSLHPKYVQDLYFASRLRPLNEDVDFHSFDLVQFSGSGINVETADPLIKSALFKLSEAWPLWVHFQDLLDNSHSRAFARPIAGGQNREDQARHLAEHLIRCYASNAVEIHAIKPRFTAEISDQPRSTPVARLQAEAGYHATNRRHEIVNLDEAARQILQRLDGTKDLGILMKVLRKLVTDKKLVLEQDGSPVETATVTDKMLKNVLEDTLRQLATAAMLVN